jgi:hypothetical protein
MSVLAALLPSVFMAVLFVAVIITIFRSQGGGGRGPRE